MSDPCVYVVCWALNSEQLLAADGTEFSGAAPLDLGARQAFVGPQIVSVSSQVRRVGPLWQERYMQTGEYADR